MYSIRTDMMAGGEFRGTLSRGLLAFSVIVIIFYWPMIAVFETPISQCEIFPGKQKEWLKEGI
jgi:hypothetical protein